MGAPDHDTRLHGKRALVTAAGQGLGAAIAGSCSRAAATW